MTTAAIIGAAGYSGQETLDRVLSHPGLELVALGSDSLAGKPASALDVRLGRNGYGTLPHFVTNDEALACGADVLFLCLEHARAAALDPPETGVVVDLSGAHRLAAADYPAWYGFEHPHAAGLADWTYALPELYPPSGRLIANPGCYATAALLALGPLVGAIDPASVIIDAKSGVSGAGKTPKASSQAAAVLENLAPYKIGTHQHGPEIAQALGFAITFVPHLVPLRRGLVATCYVTPTAELRPRLEAAYASTPAVALLEEGQIPDLMRVQMTDCAEIGLYEDRSTGRAIVVSAIDNLGKGAAGQAVQNANLVLGLPETAGLRLHGVLV